jgi:hypothetical protein
MHSLFPVKSSLYKAAGNSVIIGDLGLTLLSILSPGVEAGV